MSGTLFYVAAAACLVVLGVLVFGFVSFARGGEFNKKHSNRIMQARVGLQFLAVVLILALVWSME